MSDGDDWGAHCILKARTCCTENPHGPPVLVLPLGMSLGGKCSDGFKVFDFVRMASSGPQYTRSLLFYVRYQHGSLLSK